jgi:hypothetical protein
MNRKVIGIIFFGMATMVVVVTSPKLLDVVWCSAVVVVECSGVLVVLCCVVSVVVVVKLCS